MQEFVAMAELVIEEKEDKLIVGKKIDLVYFWGEWFEVYYEIKDFKAIIYWIRTL